MPEAGVALRGACLCVIAWAFTGMFFILVVGIVAGVGSVLVAMRWED